METVGLGIEQLIPLIRGTIANLQAHGRSALTGPVQRGDWNTVKAHIGSLLERVSRTNNPLPTLPWEIYGEARLEGHGLKD